MAQCIVCLENKEQYITYCCSLCYKRFICCDDCYFPDGWQYKFTAYCRLIQWRKETKFKQLFCSEECMIIRYTAYSWLKMNCNFLERTQQEIVQKIYTRYYKKINLYLIDDLSTIITDYIMMKK